MIGRVFLCTSICNRDFPMVAYARQWLRDHCNDERLADLTLREYRKRD